MNTIITTMLDMAKANPWLGVAIFLAIATGFLAIFLILRFFKLFVRPGCSGYVLMAGGLLLCTAIFMPTCIASILPKPLAILFYIAWGIFILWAIISSLIERGKPKTILSAYSKTNSIRIEPYCLFCRKPTSFVMEHTVEKEEEQDGTKTYSRAIYPFPAHGPCYYDSLEKDNKVAALVWISLAIGIAAVIANLAIFTKSAGMTVISMEFKSVESSIISAGIIFPLLVSGLSFVLLLIGISTEDLIKHYCEKHTQG